MIYNFKHAPNNLVDGIRHIQFQSRIFFVTYYSFLLNYMSLLPDTAGDKKVRTLHLEAIVQPQLIKH